jgi:hypothetical protein
MKRPLLLTRTAERRERGRGGGGGGREGEGGGRGRGEGEGGLAEISLAIIPAYSATSTIKEHSIHVDRSLHIFG